METLLKWIQCPGCPVRQGSANSFGEFTLDYRSDLFVFAGEREREKRAKKREREREQK